MGVKSFYRRIDLINKSNKLNLINQKDQILLSFSGGQDSICLLFMLNQHYSQLELQITLFWCHHLWQTDSFYLMQQSAKLSFLFQFNSCFAIPSNSLSSELLARKWRQSCSSRVSLFYNDSKICLAHTFNDKVETIFFNFMRGTGLTKLSPLRREQLLYKSSSINDKHVFRHPYLRPNLLLCLTPSLLRLHLRCYRRNTLKGLTKPLQDSPARLKNINITEQVVREFIRLCYAKNCYDFDFSSEGELLQICDFAMQNELNLNLLTSYPKESKLKELFLLRSQALSPKGFPNEIKDAEQEETASLTRFEEICQSKANCFELSKKNSSLPQNITCNKPSKKQTRYVQRKAIKSFTPLRAKVRRSEATQALRGLIQYSEEIRFSSFCFTLDCKGSKKGVRAFTTLVISLADQSRAKQRLSPKENKASSLLTYSEGFLFLGIALLISCLARPCEAIPCCPSETNLSVEAKDEMLFLASQRTRSKKESPKSKKGYAEEKRAFTFTDCVAYSLSLRSFSFGRDVTFACFVSLGKEEAGIKTQKGTACISRPLLSISRFEIKKICFFWKLPIYPDTSNQKVKFLRNRVRQQLSPTIKFFFNSKIENIFLQLAEIVETEDYRFTQIVNEFTKNIDVYDAKLQTHPTFTLLDKKKVSSNFVHPKNSIRSTNFNTANDSLTSSELSFGSTLVRSKEGVQKSIDFVYPSCFANILSEGDVTKMNLRGACEIEKSMVCVPKKAVGISNAKSTASVMDEFKNLKFLDLLIQLIEINKFSHNVSLLTKLIDKIASQKKELRNSKLTKILVFRFFETYHLTNLDIKKLKKKFVKEPTKILNENILAITPPDPWEAKNM